MSKPSSSPLEEISEDLVDLGVLVDQLYELESVTDRAINVEYHDDLADRLVETFQGNIKSINGKRSQLAALVEEAKEISDAEQLLEQIEFLRKEYLSLKSAVRVAHRQKGGLSTNLTSSDPERISFEPEETTAAMLTATSLERAVLRAEQNRGHATLCYEEAFIDEYARHLASDKLEAYLANSGMSAFSTIMSVLSTRLDASRPVVGLQPMYYENLHLLQRFFPKIKLPEFKKNEGTEKEEGNENGARNEKGDRNESGQSSQKNHKSEQVIEYLRATAPAAIFFDAASNHGETLVHDVESIIKWACEKEAPPVVLIIDTTCLPCLLLPDGLLKEIPPHVSILLVESLAKHHQFGMDIITGGILLLHADEAFHSALQSARATFGTEIAETSAATLPKPNAHLLERRMRRHSKNIELLANSLTEQIAAKKGAIESVTWLSQGVGPSWYRTSALNLRFRREYRTLENYREFEYKVLELAKTQNHRLALGSSFGFDITRLFMTTPGTSSADPFLRLSIGTETRNEIERFVEILTAAHEELLHTWQSSSISKQS
jgi:cystathionine beta-lyase/cystathionine gamma-synthase